MTREPAPAPSLDALSRRALLTGAGVAAVVAAGASGMLATGRGAGSERSPEGASVDARGTHQAGIARPEVPQRHCLLSVVDVDTTALRSTLRALGGAIAAVTAHPGLADLTPDGPGDLTVTVGLGARALAATAHPELADAVAFPSFSGDEALPADRLGGDLLLSVNASDATVLEPVASWLLEHVAGARVTWSQFGYRGDAVDGVARNPLGYHDGIIVPRGEDELRENVWIAEGPLAGGSICAVRRFLIDVAAFRALAPDARDAVIGRAQRDGSPLSGGGRDDEVDLSAKAPDGTLLVPLRAHARAAHPSFTGSRLMLRRSYSFHESADELGHVFISFQRDAETFSRTQLRLDESDALSGFITPTATAAFAILPGFASGEELGASLF